MKQKRFIIFLFVVILGIVGVTIWGKVQYPFSSIISIEDGNIEKITIDAKVYNLERGIITKYEKNDITENAPMWKDFQSILDRTRYRQDIQNLIPLISGSKAGLESISVWIEAKEHSYWITWYETNTFAVKYTSAGENRNKMYHLTDITLFDEMMSCIEDYMEGVTTTMGPGGIAP